MKPLEEWLRFLKDSIPFATTPILMNEFSKTEVAAVKAVFSEPKIWFCRWHFFRAMRSYVNKKIGDPSGRISAFEDFKALVRTNSIFAYTCMSEIYRSKYETYQDWILHLMVQWMNDVNKRRVACRAVNAKIYIC